MSCIFLNNLELPLFLGWTDNELHQQQIISLDIKLSFNSPPNACLSDNLSDTFCYDQLIQEIQNKFATQKIRLLEHLGYKLYQKIKLQLPPKTLVTIRVTKKPNIPHLTGGVSFCYGDEEHAW